MGNEALTNGNDVMKTLKKREKKKKRLIVLVVVAIVLVVVGVNVVNGMKRAGEAMQEAMTMAQTDVVSTRSLIKSVGATGTVISVEKEDITAGLSNVEVESVLVEIGDTVTVGQELVHFDTSDIEEKLADAKEALSDAKIRNEISVEEAARKVEDAERNQNTQIEAAQDNVDYYRGQYHNELDLYKKAEDTYASSEKSDDDKEELYKAEYDLEQAEKRLQDAIDSYNNVVANQASTVTSVKNSQTTTELSLDTTTQEKQVELYEEQLEDGILTAPISGIVTAVNYDAGDTYLQGAIVTIQDCSAFEIEAYIGEYDISDIQKGQSVLIKTDATGEEELEGTVVFVSPTAANTLTAGDVSYLVRISVDTPNERLRLDMSASLSIIIEQHENVMTVPYNAVQEDEQGNHFVEVVAEDSTTTKVPVTVVMESNYYTEIESDTLKEGQKVLLVNMDSENIFMNMMEMRGGF